MTLLLLMLGCMRLLHMRIHTRLMILPSPHRLRAQDIVENATSVRHAVDPSFHRGKHVAMDFGTLVSNGGMMEDTLYITHDLFHGDIRLFMSLALRPYTMKDGSPCELLH
jgi:hypothetical protein